MVILSNKEIQKLINNNSSEPYRRRNIAVLFGALYWGLNSIELSLLEIKDVLSDRGKLFSEWTLPGEYARNGNSRPVFTKGIMIEVIENYFNWLTEKNLSRTEKPLFGGFNPNNKLFLNDRGEPYALSKHNGNGNYVPRSMHDFLKRMIAKTDLVGVTPASLRDSYINELYRNQLGVNEIKMVSGYKTTATVEKKIQLVNMEKAFMETFKYVRI